MVPNQWVSGFNVPQGMTLNTPMVWQNGVRGQYYSPQAATYNNPTVANTKPGFNGAPGQYRGSNGELLMPQQAPRVQATTTPSYQGQSFAPNIQTGISVGPVMPQQMVQSEQNRLRNTKAAAPQGPVDYSPYMQRLNSLLSGQMNAAATDFGRDAAYANAQQQLGTEQARARAGTGWGGVALQQYGNQLGGQQQALSMLLSLLSQFGV